MRRLLSALGLALLAGFALFWALTRPGQLPVETQTALAVHAGDAARGEQVFWAAGCSGCHAAPGVEFNAPIEERLALAGGRRFATEFGTFVAPNISTDTDAGIGGWALEEFARAMLLGVSPTGAHYYPAFPYTTYTRATAEDVADLWAFWQTLPAVPQESQPHELAFPFSVRRGLGLWKWLNLRRDHITPAATDPEVARGRYLVESLSHCAECHTPRDRLGALQSDRWMAGAPNPSGDGRIPAIPPARWSAEDIAAYLNSGFTPEFDVVGGTMADVVVHMSRLPDEDRRAIAAYLLDLPARAATGAP